MTHAERMKEIKEREQAATAGPWALMDDTDDFTGTYVEALSHPQGHQQLICKEQHHCGERQDLENMEFIAHARADIPYLVARVEELEAALGEAIELIDDISHLVPLDDELLDRLTAIKEGRQ